MNSTFSDGFDFAESLSPEEALERRRRQLANGLTAMQRLFLFGKLSGMNDKDAAIAAGYSLSVAENTKQRIWKPLVLAEYERIRLLRTGENQESPRDSRSTSFTS